MTSEDKKTLLAIARGSIVNHLKGIEFEVSKPESGELLEKRGAFVTIKIKDQLRGCLGLISSKQPLYQTVADMALSASFKDTRFEPITLMEIDDLSIEISVLSQFDTITDVSDIQVGVHGIMLSSPLSQGLLLPQVPVEQRWDREAFLDHVCLKAGLPEKYWKNSDATIMTFTAEVFGDSD